MSTLSLVALILAFWVVQSDDRPPYVREGDRVEQSFHGYRERLNTFFTVLREMIDQINPDCELEVDGGIDLHTATIAVEAGANVLVSGTGIFGFDQGPSAAVSEFKKRFSL